MNDYEEHTKRYLGEKTTEIFIKFEKFTLLCLRTLSMILWQKLKHIVQNLEHINCEIQKNQLVLHQQQ